MNLKEDSVAQMLEKKLGSEWIVKRSGPGGSTISYIEGWKAIQLANEIFGYNGWNHSVVNITVDYVDVDGSKVSCGISATVRVTLRDGTFHEDIGYGSIENARTKGMAFEKAKKEAVTDALKRALKAFGNATGNCLYDKNYLKKIQRIPALTDQELKVEDLYHSSSMADSKSKVTKSASTVIASDSGVARSTSFNAPTNNITASATNGQQSAGNTVHRVSLTSTTNVNSFGNVSKIVSSKNLEPKNSLVLHSPERPLARSFSSTDVNAASIETKSFDEDEFLIAADLETMDMSLLEFQNENVKKNDPWTNTLNLVNGCISNAGNTTNAPTNTKDNKGTKRSESFRSHPYPPM